MRLDFIFILFYTVEGEGEGGGGWAFFSLHLKCGRRRGKGLFFLLNFFFIVEWLRKGKVFLFFTNSLWGEGLVESGHFQNNKHSWV